MSFCYNQDIICSIEPIDPEDILEPGQEAGFTETWYAMEYNYPGGTPLDTGEIRKIISVLAM